MKKTLFQRYAGKIDSTLAREDFDHDPPELYDPLNYVIKLGGKRLRPALCLAGCDLFGGKVEEALLPAVGLELFHNFSLVHDDIMDQAEVRRGKKTVHQKWNTNVAILSGDALLVQAYQYLAKVEQGLLPRVLKSFSQTAMQLCEGQQLDMNFEQRQDVQEEEYLEMITLKTAVLLGCALKIGALIGGAGPRQAEHLYDFGIATGLAFQVQDDWLDAYGDPDKVGKKPGGDILQDKQTLLPIYSRELAPEAYQELRTKELKGTAKVEAFRKLFEECGARRQIEEKREELLNRALSELDAAGAMNTEVQEELRVFATWLARRDR